MVPFHAVGHRLGGASVGVRSIMFASVAARQGFLLARFGRADVPTKSRYGAFLASRVARGRLPLPHTTRFCVLSGSSIGPHQYGSIRAGASPASPRTWTGPTRSRQRAGGAALSVTDRRGRCSWRACTPPSHHGSR